MGIRRGGKPTDKRHVLARIKMHAFRALDMQVATEGQVPSRERQPSQRRRYADIDANHTSIESHFEFPGCVTVS